MLEPGNYSDRTKLKNNADLIQAYLRDRGFFRPRLTTRKLSIPPATRANVIFRIKLGEQARVAAFNINIQGFDAARVRHSGPSTECLLHAHALGEDLIASARPSSPSVPCPAVETSHR